MLPPDSTQQRKSTLQNFPFPLYEGEYLHITKLSKQTANNLRKRPGLFLPLKN